MLKAFIGMILVIKLGGLKYILPVWGYGNPGPIVFSKYSG